MKVKPDYAFRINTIQPIHSWNAKTFENYYTFMHFVYNWIPSQITLVDPKTDL